MRFWKKIALCILTVALSGVFTYEAYAVTAEEQRQIARRLLGEVKTYDYGSSRGPLTELSDFIRSKYGNDKAMKKIEKGLLEVLGSRATLAGKQFVCRQLSIIGTKESVGTLAAMLNDPETSDMARYALERIPDEAADVALRKSVMAASGKARTGIITTLGVRRDAGSVSILAGFISSSNDEIASASVAALGLIGGVDAAKELQKAKDKTSGELKIKVLDAWLSCADSLMAEGKKSQAVSIYRELYKAGNPGFIRVGALRGIVASDKMKAGPVILDALRKGGNDVCPAACALVREVIEAGQIRAIARHLPKLSPQRQVQLLAAFNSPSHVSAGPVVMDAAKSKDPRVRIAAFKTLATIGDDSAVDLLAWVAADADGDEQEAARQSLQRLQDPGANKAILAGLGRAGADVKVELIRSIASRNITEGAGALLKTAADADAGVRTESLRALGDVGGWGEVTALVEMLADIEDSSDRKEAEKAIFAIAQRTGREKVVAGQIARAYSGATQEGRISYLRLLGLLGGTEALKTVTIAMDEGNDEIKEAALRSLTSFPDAGPADRLLDIAQNSPKPTHRILALRGYIKMIGLVKDNSPIRALKMCQVAMSVAGRVEEKKQVLSTAGAIATPGAAEFIEPYLDDKDLGAEAEAARKKLSSLLKNIK